MIDLGDLDPLLRAHLPLQRWYSGTAAPDSVEILASSLLHDDWPMLVQLVVLVDGVRWQLVLGLRPEGAMEPFFEGKPDAMVGVVATDRGQAVAYDATVDPELAVALLHRVGPGLDASRARLITTESTNTSLVYDERMVLKLFRRLVDGPNPDAEVTRALVAVGFANVAEPLGEWRAKGVDYAVVNGFLTGGADGFSLALTSLRDLYDRRGPPEEAGGDFAPDARRLGIITAKMHLALAEAFGTAPGDAAAWADAMEQQLGRVELPGVDPALLLAWFQRLRSVSDAGPSLRVHGDFHLGQVMRTDAGWFVLDFEGEPDRPVEERRAPSSPLRDLAGMVRSFHYAASVALRERAGDVDTEIADLASAWEHRNAFAFVEGYMAADGVAAILPADEDDREVVRRVFELDKAVYEVGYERGHRPDWMPIPLAAVLRLVG